MRCDEICKCDACGRDFTCELETGHSGSHQALYKGMNVHRMKKKENEEPEWWVRSVPPVLNVVEAEK